MSLTLYVDGPRWRAHQRSVLGERPGLVPVVKGNGYGFGRALLGAECAALGVPVVAVGEPVEAADVRAGGYGGDLLVLEPHRADGGDPSADVEGTVVTAATPQAVRALAGRRAVVEVLSSVRRFGLTPGELADVAGAVAELRLEGFAVHLPMPGPGVDHGAVVAEVLGHVGVLRDLGLPVDRLWLSHLTAAELARLADHLPGTALLPRVGTGLWLGDRGAAVARATVLAAHPLRRGDRYGYRQRRAVRDGTLLVLAGGTSHGVALAAPSAAVGLRPRARSLATGGLDAVGRALSPYHVDGAQRWFAEPPHMQVSLVWLPTSARVPAVGDEVEVDVRMTTTRFDRVVVSD
jgi:hypothetical protein